MTLKDMESLIDHSDFIRCHRSYLVNINFVQKVDEYFEQLTLTTEKEIPISRRCRAKLRDFFRDKFR